MIAAGATFAAFPAWYATMFSGFYLALLLILVLLIVRVLSFEWRERDEGDRWRGAWQLGEHREQRRRAVPVGRRACPASCTACRSTATATSPGTCSTSSTPTPCRPGSRSCCSSRSTARRSSPCARRRAAGARGAAARRLGLPVALVVARVPRVDRRRRGRPQRARPAPAGARRRRSAAPRCVLAACSRAARRERVGVRRCPRSASLAIVATLFTALYPRVLVSRAGPRRTASPSPDAAAAHYALSVITVVAVDPAARDAALPGLDLPRVPRPARRRRPSPPS